MCVYYIYIHLFIFFIHSSVDGHLGCFHMSTIINNASVNMYLLEWVFLFSSDKYPKVGLLDGMVVLFLIFWGIYTLFSIVAAPVYIPSSVKGFSFLHILTNTSYFFGFLIITSRTGVRWYLIVVLIFISLTIIDVEHLFMCLCWLSVCLLWKKACLCHLLIF